MAHEIVSSAEPAAVLSLRGISRNFGHVRALEKVDLELRRGEVLGVVGDNGAGKSTLMKIVAGTVRPDEGEIFVDGTHVNIKNAQDARRLGIEMIYQDLALFNNLDVAANIFIGRERTAGRLGLLSFLSEHRMHREAADLLARLGIKISSTRQLVEGLSGGQRQMVAIARAIAFQSKILIMDEPSAALGATESATVLDIIKGLRDHGISVILISHRIPEVLATASRVLVMKGGQHVVVLDASKSSVDECVNFIVAGRVGLDGPQAASS
jgi:ABC-type sugar transport system ATPase subunit